VRFRTAFNTRVIDGLTFQDYINYEAPIGTFERFTETIRTGKLKELSKILTEDVINNNK
jgi:hypothetical protein